MIPDNVRAFTLKFDKTLVSWFVLTQPAIKTEDGYITRVIELAAYNKLREEFTTMEKVQSIRIDTIEKENGQLRNTVDRLRSSRADVAFDLSTCAAQREKFSNEIKMLQAGVDRLNKDNDYYRRLLLASGWRESK